MGMHRFLHSVILIIHISTNFCEVLYLTMKIRVYIDITKAAYYTQRWFENIKIRR